MSKICLSIVCAAALGFGLPSGALAQDLPLENRIWNGGFEEGVAVTGIPRAWQQETDALYIPAPELVEDAFEGRFAVLLRQPTPWHHQRPQYLWQRVPALPGRPQVLRCRLKGAGLGYLYLQPMTAKGKAVGEPLLREVGLCEEYTAHQLAADMPEGADWVEVRIGTRRIFTDLYADAVFFGLAEDAGAAPEPEPEPKSLAADAGLRNLAPRAQIEVLPPPMSASLMNAQHYLMGNRGLSALVDGDPETSLCFSHCAERMGRLTFRFPAPVDVAALRVHTTDVSSFLVRIDTDGDGRFDHVAARCEGVEAGWRRVAVGRRAVALRFEVLEGRIGYRSALHRIHEVEILSADAAAAKALEGWAGASVRPAQLSAPATPLRLRDWAAPPEGFFVKEVPSFRKGITVETWMFGFKPDPAFSYGEDNPAFQAMLAGLKELRADWVWLFTPTWQYWSLGDTYRGATEAIRVLMWPNDYFDGLTFNALKPFCDAVHGQGMQVIGALTYGMMPQYDKTLFFYPAEETSRYPGKKQRPSIIFGDHYRKTWTSLLLDMMDSGCDGVSVCADELYYKGHFLKTIPARMEDLAVYRRLYGEEPPREEADTLAYRRWVMMRHQGLAELYRNIVGTVRQKHPQAVTTSNFMVPLLGGHVDDQCFDFPMLGRQSGIDHFGSDYLSGYGYKYMTACAGWRQSHILAQGGTWEEDLVGKLRPIKQSGTILRGLTYGLSGVSHYRYNYIMRNENAKRGVIEGYSAADDLDRTGMYEAQPPAEVALLHSRNSEDWHQIRAWYGEAAGPCADRAMEGFRGLYAHRTLGGFLMEKGIPYELRFLDREDAPDLSRHKLLVLPFGYALSEANAAAIGKAVAAGAGLLMFEHQAPTDEWGRPRTAPRLAHLVTEFPDRVRFFGEPLLRFDAPYKARVMQALGAMAPDLPMQAENYGRVVEAAMLVNERLGRHYVTLLNWEQTPARCDLRLALPGGRYAMTVRDEVGFKDMLPEGADFWTAESLRDLRLRLPGGGFRVLVLERVE